MAVRISEVVEALTEGDNMVRYYYEREADELVSVMVEYLERADRLLYEGKTVDDGDLLYWEVGLVEDAMRILQADDDAFVPLPSQWDVHMHRIMEDFVRTLPESQMQERIWNDLHRSGAFRRFRDHVYRYEILDAWFRFRDERLAEIAREWAEDNQIVLVG